MRAPSERETILSNFDKTSRLRAGRLPGEGKRGQGDFDFPLSPLLNPVPLPNFQFVNGSRIATELANSQLAFPNPLKRFFAGDFQSPCQKGLPLGVHGVTSDTLIPRAHCALRVFD